MPTTAEIAANASCFSCISNQGDAIIYLLAQIAGVPDPATIAANASCFVCIPNKQEAILYLLNEIATNGTGGGAGATDFFVTSGTGPPASSPAGASRWYVDLSNGATYYSDGVTWILKS